MGLFDDLSQFLESRLEEFLRNNPHLELQALEEQLRQQEEDTLHLIADLQLQEKRLQDQILETAQEIQRWHNRIEKAKAAGRLDLLQPAQEREAALLRQGNQLWGQMEGVKTRVQKAKELQQQIQLRRQEVQTKATEAVAAKASQQAEQRGWETMGWNQGSTYIYGSSGYSNSGDPLEQKFQRWEAEDELEQLKRNMGR